MSSKLDQIKDQTLIRDKAFVGGEWVAARSGEAFEVTDPATNQVISRCPEFDAQDVEDTVEMAKNAFPLFRNMPGRQRSDILRKWHQLMLDNAEDLAVLITLENGKPLADARGEIKYASDFLLWFAEEAPRTYGQTLPSSTAGNRIFTRKEPVGVCGLITPWNFPAAMVTRKAAPAIAAGCTVVLKAPGETPLSSLALAELSRRAGLPPGVFNVVTTLKNTPEIGYSLTTHPQIKKVSFTGSTEVGKLLMKQCSGSLKKLSMELGGNAPFIIFDDADINAAVNGVVTSKFRSSGQTCVCANRIYVQKGIYDSFADKLLAKIRAFKVGTGLDEGTTHGPLISAKAVKKSDEHVQDAVAKGAKVLIGGRRHQENVESENFYQPTVLTDCDITMRISNEETFGPVAALFPFETERQVVELANSSEAGLGGYLFSQNIQRCWRIAEALEVGMVGVNTGLLSEPVSPFGGVKQSGFGREGSSLGIEEYLTVKSITVGGIETIII